MPLVLQSSEKKLKKRKRAVNDFKKLQVQLQYRYGNDLRLR